jgi:hypothetical protein
MIEMNDDAGPAPALSSSTTAEESVSSLLGIVPGPGSAACSYQIAGASASDARLRRAAEMIAEDAMQLRCGKSPVLDVWRGRAAGGPPHTLKDRRAVEAFVTDTFGLPSAPGTPDLLQGFVAELVWHRLVRERTAPGDGRTLIHVADLSWSAYQQGGDGLVVYEIVGGELVFRLWEIKKHDSAAHLSRTVGRACKQLSSGALRYLAQFTAYGSELEGDLGRLFGQLVPLWLNDDPRAGVGVSIATSTEHAPKRRAFGGVATAFPQFTGVGQREGLVVAVADFPTFATTVREVIWTGL